MDDTRQIRPISPAQIEEALELAWLIFSNEIAPDCPQDASDEMWDLLDLDYNIHRAGDGELRFWGAFEGDSLVGMCAMRGIGHLHLLFVDEDCRFQGMGTSLVKKAIIDSKTIDSSLSRVTVNALPGSEGFFQTLGFKQTGQPDALDGLPFIPMEINA